MPEKLITANNAVTTINNPLSALATNLVLLDIIRFPVLNDPDDYCILTLIRQSDGASEIVKCTAQDLGTSSYTILRGQEGTTPLEFIVGDESRNLLTAGQIEYLDSREEAEAQFVKTDGTSSMTGDLDLGSNKQTNVADGVDPNDGVNLAQVNTLISTATEPTTNIKLTTIDMTNGGANDKNNIDIFWQSAWDAYDYVDVVISDAISDATGQIAFALSSDSGSTWLTLTGSSLEAMSWSDISYGVGDTFRAIMEMNVKGHQKVPYCKLLSSSNNLQAGASNNFKLGTAFQYSGSTLTGPISSQNWDSWDTGSDGLSGYLLRFTHETGNFTSGTLKIIGYKYP